MVCYSGLQIGGDFIKKKMFIGISIILNPIVAVAFAIAFIFTTDLDLRLYYLYTIIIWYPVFIGIRIFLLRCPHCKNGILPEKWVKEGNSCSPIMELNRARMIS